MAASPPPWYLLSVGRVFQIVAIVMFALCIGQATRASSVFAAGDDCSDGCPDDQKCPGENSDGECPPDCQLCMCCGITIKALVPVSTATLPSLCVQRASARAKDRLPPSAEPQEILHVPKLTFA